MPELPDIQVYLERLDAFVRGHPLERFEIATPFVLRSVWPSPSALEGRRVTSLRRIGKRIVIGFEGDDYLVIHLMIAGRLRWRPPGAKGARAQVLATLRFPHGALMLTEAGRTRRASIHIVHGEEALAEFERGGLEPLEVSHEEFATRLRSENHTLKRALTDPRMFSGIGNAYSDEILHRARLSPLALTSRLNDDDVARLYEAIRTVLVEWTDRLRAEVGDGFPDNVTAFRPQMAVHGRYRQPCLVCGTAVQRIRYADNETNYCPRCQTGGRLLADRAMSRLLRQDWPRRIEEIE